MADENEATPEEGTEAPPNKGNKKLIIIIAAAVVVLIAGGFVGYTLMSGGEETHGEEEAKDSHGGEEAKGVNSAMLSLAPFILNLVDQGRYLKVTIEFEISADIPKEQVALKTPQLRDTIITLIGSKSIKAIASPEGKFQLKDELLFRANQILGMEQDIIKNIYFTEFVMQ